RPCRAAQPQPWAGANGTPLAPSRPRPRPGRGAASGLPGNGESHRIAPRRTAAGPPTSSPDPMTAAKPLNLHPDRLFPPDATQRAIARRLYAEIAGLPIVSPHGHTDPSWWAGNGTFANATELLLVPDHYVFRMLYSQGIGLDALGIPRADGSRAQVDPREAWRLFAQNFHL